MKARAKLTNDNQVKVITRSSIPSIGSVIIDNISHNLGQVLDFRKHPDLAAFMPETVRPSFAWARLKPNEELAEHEHPTPSMIIVCEGEGEVFGDCNQHISAGDIVIVPPHHKHGFLGRGNNGLWVLSVQFEGLAFYEDIKNPRVQFSKKGKQACA